MIRTNEGTSPTLGSWLCYSGFVAANLIFVAVWVAGYVSAALAGPRRWASAIILIQVLSWLIVNLVTMEKGDRFCLEIGYFTWLLSFGLLSIAQVLHPIPWISTDEK
jgi:hypothetical protein